MAKPSLIPASTGPELLFPVILALQASREQNLEGRKDLWGKRGARNLSPETRKAGRPNLEKSGQSHGRKPNWKTGQENPSRGRTVNGIRGFASTINRLFLPPGSMQQDVKAFFSE